MTAGRAIAVSSDDPAAGVAGSHLAHSGQQLAHVLKRERVTALGHVHRHTRKLTVALDAYERPGLG